MAGKSILVGKKKVDTETITVTEDDDGAYFRVRLGEIRFLTLTPKEGKVVSEFLAKAYKNRIRRQA